MDVSNKLKAHAKHRNKIVHEMKQIFRDNRTLSTEETCQEQHSPVVEDLLQELGSPKLRKYNDYDRTSCYRCQHFLNIPQNILQSTYDTVSTSKHDYKTELTFVQAIVWLKSAISSMKDISVEQFHLIFHKQWNQTEFSAVKSDESLELSIQNSLIELEKHDSRKRKFDSDTGTFISIDVANNKSHSTSQLCNTQHVRADNASAESGLGKDDLHAVSPLRPYAHGTGTPGNTHLLKECIIPSSPDIFEDSSQYHETPYNKDTECQTLRTIDSHNAPQPKGSGSNAFCTEVLKNTTDDIPRNNEDDEEWMLDPSGHRFSQFDEEFTLDSRSSLHSFQSSMDDEQCSDANIDIGDLGVASLSTSLSLSGLSAHTLYNETELSDNTTNGIDNNTALPVKEIQKKESTFACSKERDTKRQIYTAKRKSSNPPTQYPDNERRKLSSVLLNYALETLNANVVAFQSVKIILSFFQTEGIIKDYMTVRRWEDTLEKEAVNAVLNFCEIYEMETKTDLCSQEIIQTVIETLERIIGNTALNKTTLSIHHISIILEFCNLLRICIGAIDFLTAKLKSYEIVVTSTTNGTRVAISNVVNQLHLLFHSLRICLQKYRTVFTCKRDHGLEKYTFPTTIELWKKKLNSDHTIQEENATMREQRWLSVFGDFSVIAAECFPQFAEKARSLIRVLTDSCIVCKK